MYDVETQTIMMAPASGVYSTFEKSGDGGKTGLCT